MNYLTDTHTFIWSMIEPGKLSGKVKKIIEDPRNNILVSAVNFWEISLKHSIGKLVLDGISPQECPFLATKIGFQLISITPEEAATYHLLKGDWHKDPFDRMLIWQAIKRNYTLISKDRNIQKYKETGLKVEWQ